MKICCVIPSLQPGGMERVMSVLINGFIHDHNAEVHVVLYGASREVFYGLNEGAYIHMPDWEFDKQHRTHDTFKTMRYLRKTLRSMHPDAILSFGSRWNSLVLLSCFGLRLPIYISDRGTPISYSKDFQFWLKKILYPKAKGIVVQTSLAEKLYRQRYRQTNFEVIGNPIRNISIPQDIQRENAIVSVARLVDLKHFDRLIAIFESIGNQDWKLIIVGGNADGQHILEDLQQLRETCLLKENIVLTGTQKDVDTYLLRSKIFAFTSSQEGFPNAIGEAMSAGLPVVSYDCITGPSEMIENGQNGYLTKVFDDETFKERLETLMNDEDLRAKMGKQAKESIGRFSEGLIVEKFYTFITQTR